MHPSLTLTQSSISLFFFFGTLFKKYFTQYFFFLLVRIVILHIIIWRLVKDKVAIMVAIWVLIPYTPCLNHATLGRRLDTSCSDVWSQEKDTFVKTTYDWDFNREFLPLGAGLSLLCVVLLNVAFGIFINNIISPITSTKPSFLFVRWVLIGATLNCVLLKLNGLFNLLQLLSVVLFLQFVLVRILLLVLLREVRLWERTHIHHELLMMLSWIGRHIQILLLLLQLLLFGKASFLLKTHLSLICKWILGIDMLLIRNHCTSFFLTAGSPTEKLLLSIVIAVYTVPHSS